MIIVTIFQAIIIIILILRTLFLYDEKDRQKLSLLASNAGKQYLDKIVKRGQK